MPLYEYQCNRCEACFELLIRSGKEKPICPKCGSEDLKRLISTFSAQIAPACKNVGNCPGASPHCNCGCHGHCK